MKKLLILRLAFTMIFTGAIASYAADAKTEVQVTKERSISSTAVKSFLKFLFT